MTDHANDGTGRPEDGLAALTRAELEQLAEEQGAAAYRAEDTLAFVREMCDIADRNHLVIRTADVRRWLNGPACPRIPAGRLPLADRPAMAVIGLNVGRGHAEGIRSSRTSVPGVGDEDMRQAAADRTEEDDR